MAIRREGEGGGDAAGAGDGSSSNAAPEDLALLDPDDTGGDADGEGAGDNTPNTVLSDKGGDGDGERPVATPGDWPGDWREKMSGDDKKAAKQLARYASPLEVSKALLAAQQKITSGEYKRGEPPENATDKEMMSWRKENGIPQDPAGYLENLPEGLVIGEKDKDLFASFAESLHGANLPPETASVAAAWYYRVEEEKIAAADAADLAEATTVDDELRAEWGGEHRGNINSIKNFLATAPDGIGEQLMGGRLADGRRLFNDPGALRWMLGVADELNPQGRVLPNSGGNAAASIDDRIAEIDTMMREDRAAYNKNEGVQKEYRDLIDAKNKMSKKAA